MNNRKKKKIAVLFGGKSGEHEVSIASAISVNNALDKTKYDVVLIGIDKNGRWLLPSESSILAQVENPRLIKLNQEKETISLLPFEHHNQQLVSVQHQKGIGSEGDFLNSKIDVIIPILHGTYGEDGTVQGLLELSNIPYVGTGVLGSALGMDKDVSRKLLKAEGIPVVPTIVARKHEYEKNKLKILQEVVEQLGFPFFVKPANMGSSVGVHKVKSHSDAYQKIEDAFLYDNKILFEQAINARELECSVLGNFEPQASIVGEIIPQHEFYSYEAKYIDDHGAILEIPVKNLPLEVSDYIRQLSILAFKTLECRGMARVDFFFDKDSGKLYLNEINTIPGFTKISMYPKLWEASGKPYSQLLDDLINLAIEVHSKKNALKTSI